MTQVSAKLSALRFQDILTCQANGDISNGEIASDLQRKQIKDIVKALQDISDEDLKSKAHSSAQKLPKNANQQEMEGFMADEFGIGGEVTWIKITSMMLSLGDVVATMRKNDRLKMIVALCRAGRFAIIKINSYVESRGGWGVLATYINENIVKKITWRETLGGVIIVAVVLVLVVVFKRR